MKYSRQTVAGILLVVITLFLAGCSLRSRGITAQVNELTSGIDEYLAEYKKEFAVLPRPADEPLAAAEAYMRAYQPGPLPRVFQTTYIYDRHGTQLARLHDEGYRTWVPLDKISQHLIDAVIATEDASFFSNPGFDPRRVIGAIMQNAEAGEVISGASTITMQLARQLFFTPAERFEQTMERKAFEALLAQDLTAIFTKDEILEMYLNLVHFGHTAYGIEAAAQFYFEKAAADLGLAEATLLAGIPQQPGDYDLFSDLPNVKKRQRIVLDLMVRHGFLTANEANEVFAQEVALRNEEVVNENLAPHFVQYTVQTLGEQLQVDIRRSGMQLYTTLDLGIQELAQQTVTAQVERLRPQFDLGNAALVAIKPGTAEILAMVGSADFNNEAIDGQVNVAVRQRQPGSAIKPILYATAIDDYLISPGSVIWDLAAEYEIGEDDTYRPLNYDERFHGPVTVRTALANSYNVPAVKLLDAVGVKRMLDQSRALGIHSLSRDEQWYGLSLTLGGGEVTLLELTGAFHALANQGLYVPMQFLDQSTVNGPAIAGDIVAGADLATREAVQVFSPETAFLITDIMSDERARTPAFGTNSALKISRPAAAKTGTTTDFRDNWTVGYTKYLVAGVWAGNSDGRPMRNASGVTGAAPIWNAFMEGVLSDPSLLAALNAPDDPDAWNFSAVPGVSEVAVNCPTPLLCDETEYVRAGWVETLAAEARGSALVDSIYAGPVSSVIVERQGSRFPVGGCGQPSDDSRTLLRLPDGIGREMSNIDFSERGEAGILASSDRWERIQEEQIAALEWSASAGMPLYLGPCEVADALLRLLLGDSITDIAIAPYSDQVASLNSTTTSNTALVSAPPPQQARVSSSYNLLGVAHDSYCGGAWIVGQVSNSDGASLAGINVVYQDVEGNRQVTATSADAANFGSFAFPILSDAPQDILITIVDGAGSAISNTARVPHNQGGPTDQPCHFVIWTGTD